MTINLGVVMDPIQNINVNKDSTLAMLVAAQKRGWQLNYMELNDLILINEEVHAHMRPLEVSYSTNSHYKLGQSQRQPLHRLDIVLMRKDPPFDMEYVYATYLLELAEKSGTLVVNKPQSLRDANEKLFTAWFPGCCPPTIVTRNAEDIKAFLRIHQDIIIKPLGGMGGTSIFRVEQHSPNVNVIIETLTQNGTQYTMAQQFIPQISAGDKRILLINGEPIPHGLSRIPKVGETRGNLARGATGVGMALSDRDRWICEQVGPTLRAKGLVFVGLDVIGDYLTEINVTCPTCIRELDTQFNLDIGSQLMDTLADMLNDTSSG